MNKILIVDTETGGQDPETSSLLSISGVVLDIKNKKYYELFDFYVYDNPLKITKESLKINKIDVNKVITEGLSPKDALDKIVNSVYKEFEMNNKVTLAGHNISFDISFIKKMFKEHSNLNFFDVFSYRNIDTASIGQFLLLTGHINTEKSVNLDFLIKFLGIPYESNIRHTALGDCKLTAEVLLRLSEKYKATVV